MVTGVIIGHGRFAEAILASAAKIVGEQPDVEVVSNENFSCETLSARIAQLVQERKDEDTLVFLDLPGGSCTISCYTVLKDHRELNVISGVNLPMLLEFFMLRDKYTAGELVPILIKKGKENIIQLRCKDECRD
jgi:mannose/fructose-specific phosphotransferase system component IIA